MHIASVDAGESDRIEQMARLLTIGFHAIAPEFYRRLGYTIIGVVPDANGYGKPDIWMAKRL